MENAANIPVSRLLSGTISALSALVQQNPRSRAELERTIETLRNIEPEVAQLFQGGVPIGDSEPRLAAGIVEPRGSGRDVLRAWGADLERRRQAAGFSRGELARLAGLSESTLRNIERARNAPTRSTIMSLQSVPALRFGDSLPPSSAGERSLGLHEAMFMPNCWLAPEYDAIKLHSELTGILRGGGGHIEQTYLYLDAQSAESWVAYAEQPSYTSARMAMPLRHVAEQLAIGLTAGGLDLIGLGCGDGRDEVRLAQHILELIPNADLRLYLLDISQPLLCAAYRHAAASLGDSPRVSVYGIQGSFHNLQRYSQLLSSPGHAPRQRIICMFGNTFANLQNEILFIRNSLIGCSPGDMLLFTVAQAMAPADEPDEIRRRDPRLSGRAPAGLGLSRFDEQLTGLLRRYIPGVNSVELNSMLDVDSCPVPGSYAADVRASVKLQSGETKQFSIYYSKRYEPDALNRKLEKEGWAPLTYFRLEEAHPRLLLLYRRIGQPVTMH